MDDLWILQDPEEDTEPPWPEEYGPKPEWWGKGRAAAGQAARDAIQIGDKVVSVIRADYGKRRPSPADLAQLPNRFRDPDERKMAAYLCSIISWVKRGKPWTILGVRGKDGSYRQVSVDTEMVHRGTASLQRDGFSVEVELSGGGKTDRNRKEKK